METTATVFALCELTFAAGVLPSTGRTSQDDVTRCTSRAYANTPINSNADPMHFCMLGARACASPSLRPKGLENLALGISQVPATTGRELHPARLAGRARA